MTSLYHANVAAHEQTQLQEHALQHPHHISGQFSPRPHVKHPPRAAAKTTIFKNKMKLIGKPWKGQHFLADSSSSSSASPISSCGLECKSDINSLLSSDTTEAAPSERQHEAKGELEKAISILSDTATSGSPTPPEDASSFAVGSSAFKAAAITIVPTVKIEPAPEPAPKVVDCTPLPVSAQVQQQFDAAPVNEYALPDGSSFTGTKAAWLERLFLNPDWTDQWMENAFTPSRLQRLKADDPAGFDDTALVVQAIAYGQDT